MVLGVFLAYYFEFLEKLLFFDYTKKYTFLLKIAILAQLSKFHMKGLKYENIGHI